MHGIRGKKAVPRTQNLGAPARAIGSAHETPVHKLISRPKIGNVLPKYLYREIARVHRLAQEPGLFVTAPVGAIRKLFDRTGWSAKDVDLFEINEAFAVVTLAAMREHVLPHEKVNVHGGACALGHPIGASGARILVTLIGALGKYGLKRGVASLCIGGGEATAMAIELA